MKTKMIRVFTFLLVEFAIINEVLTSTEITIIDDSLISKWTSDSKVNSPCAYITDRRFHGISVDCQNLGLSEMPPMHWIPPNTTSLFLTDNNIREVQGKALTSAPNLRLLALRRNNIRYIHPDTFRNNSHLSLLDLSGNAISLDKRIINGPLFNGIDKLLELYIAYNGNGDMIAQTRMYSPLLLSRFPNLQLLAIDTFRGDLNFNGIFKATKNLRSLTITGGVGRIRNDTFQDFEAIELQALNLDDVNNLVFTETGAYKPLRFLKSFRVRSMRQDLKNTLDGYAYFVGRNFTRVTISNYVMSNRGEKAYTHNNILTADRAKYLTKMCIQHLILTYNKLFFIEKSVFVNDEYVRCLISLDLSGNPLMGSFAFYFYLHRFLSLQSFIFTNRLYAAYMFSEASPLLTNMKHTYESTNANALIRLVNMNIKTTPRGLPNKISKQPLNAPLYVRMSRVDKSNEQLGTHASFVLSSNNNFCIKLQFPPSIRYINMNDFHKHSIKLNIDIEIVGGEYLEEIHMSKFGIFAMSGKITGLQNVKIIDFSRNDGSQLSQTLIESFLSLIHLNMSSMNLGNFFLRHDSPFRSLSALESLDLSNNGLYTLPSNVFQYNTKLTHIYLGKNQFQFISFRLTSLNSLMVLDLRLNNFLRLSIKDTQALTDHAMKLETPFRVHLQGNAFSCGCESGRSIFWMQNVRHIQFDENDYKCLDSNGQVTTMSQNPMEVIRRKCFAVSAMHASFTLLVTFIFLFILTRMFVKFKKPIIAMTQQLFMRHLVMKTPEDYTTGVYLSYSGQEFEFVCGPLREFIEERVALTTYFRDRDEVPGLSIVTQMMKQINAAWRIVLVISEEYLQDELSLCAMQAAVYSITLTNPGRLVLILVSESERVLRDLPDFVLASVPDSNIVMMPEEDFDFDGEAATA